MDTKTKEHNDEIEIDLQRLFRALWGSIWMIALAAVICAVISFVGTFFLITPKYESSAMFYVNNSSLSLGDASLSIDSGDISASRNLVKSYIVILNTRESLNDVIDYAGVNRTYGELRSMLSAAAVDNTEIFRVVVTCEDPVEAEKIADAIGYILPKRIASIIEGTSAKVVESAVVPSRPSSPSYPRNTILGFVVGLVLAAALVVIREMMDITIRTEEDIAQSCDHPVLAAVPNMESGNTKANYYSPGRHKKSYGKSSSKGTKQAELVGGNISFAAAEAYKLLRTKLQFSFADENKCHVIGVSSALTSEGKSLSAVNLAYSISELGKRVLLIDCDMRRPSLSEKLPIKKSPGLSDFLTGQASPDSLLQMCGIQDDERAFHAVSSGRTPPNPMELLSSSRMSRMIAVLRENYDYIILDLPPVAEVSDALAVSKLTDGMLLVVRQNLCDRIALNAAIRQFEFVDAKILGIVFNCTVDEGSRYGYGSRYYKRYAKKYRGTYGTKYAREYAGVPRQAENKSAE